MVYKWCVVPQCINTSIKSPNKLFVSVPTNPKRRKMWLHLARRDPKSILMHTNVFMCEDHFDMEKDTKNYMMYKMGFSQKILLADTAVPTKFHCQEDRNKRLSDNGSSRKVFLKRQRTDLVEECPQSQRASETYAESLQNDDMTENIIESKEGSSRPKALTFEKPDKTHIRKCSTQPANVEKPSSNEHLTSITGSVQLSTPGYCGNSVNAGDTDSYQNDDIKVEPEEGGRGSPAAAVREAGPLRGAAVKLEHFEVDESRSACDQRNDDVKFHFNSLRNEDGIGTVIDALEPDARQVPKQQHYKCGACGGSIEGFRYACVQCAEYNQCAECEASGAHAEHYVLRVPRVERAVQTVLDRVRRELMQLDSPVQIKLEKDDAEEDVREEEILDLKTEPAELKGGIDPLQCAGVGVGAEDGAVKQEVIDINEDLFKCNKVLELPIGTTYKPRGRPRGCSTPLDPVTERRRRKARESNEQRQLRLQQHRETQRNCRQLNVRRQQLDHDKSLVRSAEAELPELPPEQP